MNIFFVILLFIIAIICFKFGAEIPFHEQWPLYESLRNTSAIIFGVMGAWIAIIYPKVLSKIYNKAKIEEIKNESKKIHRLISPMIYATTIVAIVLIIGLLAPIFKRIPFFLNHTSLIRSITFSLLGILTILQLWSLILTLVPTDMIIRNIGRFTKRREILSKRFRNLKQK